MKNFLPILLIFTITFFSCSRDCIDESGTKITDNNDITGFTEINVDGDFDVDVDTGFYGISIEADRAFMPYIKLEKVSNTLNISISNNRCLNGTRPYIHIYTPDLFYVTQKGSGIINCYNVYNEKITLDLKSSGKIELNNLDTYEVYAKNSGSGSILLEGKGKYAEYTLSGSGTIKGYNFPVDDADVYIPGSGAVYVYAYDILNIDISGSGSALYRGKPNLNYRITGSGEVIDDNN